MKHQYEEMQGVREALCLLDTPRALSVWLLYYYGMFSGSTLEHDQLLALEPSWPTKPGCTFEEEALMVYKDLQAVKLLSKVESLNTSYDREKNAIQQFLAAEEKAAISNVKFRSAGGFSPTVEECLSYAIRDIAAILPDVPSVSECLSSGSIGPGGSTFVTRSKAVTASKLSEFCCSPYLFKEHTVRDFWVQNVLFKGAFKLIDHDKIVTVPKNGKTFRTIGIGPTANMVAQKGAASYVRRALRLWGIDIQSQEKNQRAAQKGFVTVDLKNGSANVSLGLANCLLPLDWAELLFNLRMSDWVYSHTYKTSDGDQIVEKTEEFRGVYNQLSGMGNGYTFEVETLIFASVARACARMAGDNPAQVLVYGDDIILPSDAAYRIFVDVAKEVGLEINRDKTYSGLMPYRESCGKHFWGGIDVSYETIKGTMCSDTPETAYLLHNIVLTIGIRLGDRVGTNVARARIIRNSPCIMYCRPSAGLKSGFWLTGLNELLEFGYLPAQSIKDRKSGLFRKRKGFLEEWQLPVCKGDPSRRKYYTMKSKPMVAQISGLPLFPNKNGGLSQVGFVQAALLPNKLNPYTLLPGVESGELISCGSSCDGGKGVYLPGTYAWVFSSIEGPNFHDDELRFILRNCSVDLAFDHVIPPLSSNERKRFE